MTTETTGDLLLRLIGAAEESDRLDWTVRMADGFGTRELTANVTDDLHFLIRSSSTPRPSGTHFQIILQAADGLVVAATPRLKSEDNPPGMALLRQAEMATGAAAIREAIDALLEEGGA